MTMVEPIRPTQRKQQPSSFARTSDFPPGNSFKRLITAKVWAQVFHCHPWQAALELWPHDRVTHEIVQRAASAPAMTTTVGWAAELAQKLIVDTLDALGPVSAAAQLMKDGLVLSWDGAGIISVPGFVADSSDAAWVAEGDPIPVNQMAATAAAINPRKLATIAVLTREMIESSNAEALISDALTRAAGLALDAAFFDSNAASAARPAGIRNGISTLTASTNTDFFSAVAEDIATLLSAVGTVGGPGPYALVGVPGRTVGMSMNFQNVQGLRFYGAPSAGTALIAIACQALVAALSSDPEIETSKASSLHMSDAPLPVGPAGAAPHKSMWQTDSIAVKVRWPASWALRDPRGVAWLTPAWK
jgi:hypothetical protein